MPLLGLIFLVFLGVVTPQVAVAAKNPFRVEVLETSASVGKTTNAQIMVVVPKGYHVYRDMMSVVVLDAAGLSFETAQFPIGELTADPANPGQTRELFKHDVAIELPFQAPTAAGDYKALLEEFFGEEYPATGAERPDVAPIMHGLIEEARS